MDNKNPSDGQPGPSSPPQGVQSYATVESSLDQSVLQRPRIAETPSRSGSRRAIIADTNRRGQKRTAEDEAGSLQDEEEQRRIALWNIEVSKWIDQVRPEDEAPTPFDMPSTGHEITPSDAESDVYEHPPDDGQTYLSQRALDTVDHQNSQPPPIITSVQPPTANDAIMRFSRHADTVSIVSRAATWGTRRRSASSLLDSESIVDSLFLKRIRTMSSQGSMTGPKSPLTSVFSRMSNASIEKRPSALEMLEKRFKDRATSPSPEGMAESISGSSSQTPEGLPTAQSTMERPQSDVQIGDDDTADEEDGQDDLPKMASNVGTIVPNPEGFRQHFNQLNANMDPRYHWLAIRIEHQQMIRYKTLLDFKIKHFRAVSAYHCPAAGRCMDMGGSVRYLENADANLTTAPHLFAKTSSNCDSGEIHKDDDKKRRKRFRGNRRGSRDTLELMTDPYEETSPIVPLHDIGGVQAPNIVEPVEVAYPPGIPTPPNQRFPAEFECQICFKVKKFQVASDWIKHVHEDLQTFTCTFESCKEPKSFMRKADWVRHENERHRHLKWWTCETDDCRDTTFYRIDNFLQHLAREHKVPDLKQNTTAAMRKVQSTEPAWNIIDKSQHETTNRPQDEPCKFCGTALPTWKKLTVHLAKHMEQIALPVLALVKAKNVDANSIVSSIEQHPARENASSYRNLLRLELGLSVSESSSVPKLDTTYTFRGKSFEFADLRSHTPSPVHSTKSTIGLGRSSPLPSFSGNPFESAKPTPVESVRFPPFPNSYSLHQASTPNRYTSSSHRPSFQPRKPDGSRPPMFSWRDRTLNASHKPGHDNEHWTEIGAGVDDKAQSTSNFPAIQFNPCHYIRTQILEGLLDPITEVDSTESFFHATFHILWDLQNFIHDQYKDTPAIGTIITLSGTALHAQASTCNEYLLKNWPSYGSKVMTAIQDALDSSDKTSNLEFPGLRMSIDLFHASHSVKIYGSVTSIIEVAEVLAWMGATFRTSSSSNLQYSEVTIESLDFNLDGKNDLKNTFLIGCKIVPLPEEEHSCWYPLFVNPLIARGFPTTPRDNDEAGLEIPIEMMAALGGARYAVEFEGGLLLKGFFSLFVPTKRHANSIQWHLIYHTNKTRLTYSEVRTQCPERALLDEVDHDSLQNTRAFLGWWRTSKTCLGTDGYNYSATTYSSAMPASITKSSSRDLSFSRLLFRNQNMSIGAKDSRLFLSRAGPLQQIMEWAEMMPILLYDVMDRRGWFVRASDVILHTIRTRHAKRPFCVEGKPVRLVGADYSLDDDQASAKAILDMASVKLVQDDVNRANDYYVNDLVSDIWALLEGLSEMQNIGETNLEYSTKAARQHKLEGWEFMALVDRKSPIQRKQVELEKSTGGWQNLIQEVNAVVLLAHNFGDIIQPLDPSSGLCPKWRELPKEKDYMAAGVPLLKRLCEEAGSTSPYLHLTPSKLQWHRGSMLFETCSGKGTRAGTCDCERLQQVVPKSASEIPSINPPGHLEDKGCVMFGSPSPPPVPSVSVHPAPEVNGAAVQRDGKNYNSEFVTPMGVSINFKSHLEDTMKTNLPIPVLESKRPSQNWEANGDYRYNGVYAKSRDYENFPSLGIKERSSDSFQSRSEDENETRHEVKRANKRYFYDYGDTLRENKRNNLDTAPLPMRMSETERAWEMKLSNSSLSTPMRDSQHKFGTPEIVDTPQNGKCLVMLGSTAPSESERAE